MLLLKPNSGLGAMTGINRAIVRQREQFFFDIGRQLFKISAWEIPAADTAFEQYVAADQ